MSTTVRREASPPIDEDAILSRLVTSEDLLVVCDFEVALCATGGKMNEASPGKRALRVMSDLAGTPCTSVAILASDCATWLRRSAALSQPVVHTCTADSDHKPTDAPSLSKVLAIDALLTTHSPNLIFFAGGDDSAETVLLRSVSMTSASESAKALRAPRLACAILPNSSSSSSVSTGVAGVRSLPLESEPSFVLSRPAARAVGRRLSPCRRRTVGQSRSDAATHVVDHGRSGIRTELHLDLPGTSRTPPIRRGLPCCARTRLPELAANDRGSVPLSRQCELGTNRPLRRPTAGAASACACVGGLACE